MRGLPQLEAFQNELVAVSGLQLTNCLSPEDKFEILFVVKTNPASKRCLTGCKKQQKDQDLGRLKEWGWNEGME